MMEKLTTTVRVDHRISGFTLIELVVTLAISGILLSIAVPAFTNLLMNNRATAQVNGLLNAMNFARANALTKNVNVSVCPLGALNSVVCGASWAAGWIITTQPPTGTGVLLQSYQIGPKGPVLSAVPIGGTSATSVLFDSRGLAGTPANFKFCDSRGSNYARSLQVLATGSSQLGVTQGQAIWGGGLTCP